MAGGGGSSLLPVEVVGAWVNAFNVRDLGGMLNRVDEDVDFHPLRLTGVTGCYHGHDGLREWFELLTIDPEIQIDLSDVHVAPDEDVLAAGYLLLGPTNLAPYCALHRVVAARITFMQQYLSDLETLKHLSMTR